MTEINNIKKLRQRFVKDYNLPINVFEDELFEYYMKLYDFFPHSRYNELLEKVKTEYNGNVDKWLEYCSTVRDSAIEGVMETDVYRCFNSMDLSCYNFSPICSERSCYTNETNMKRFVSIDLKKANFQALKYIEVLDDNTYYDFVKRFGGDNYIANSKYLRQVIFGKMNPSRQIKIEKFLVSEIYLVIKDITDKYGLTIFSMNSDELVYSVPNNFLCDSTVLFNEIYEEVDKHLKGIEIKVEYVEIRKINIISPNGTNIDAYERFNINTGESVLKKASTTFYPQIYKLWKGMPIEKNDLVFYFENQLATFNKPLIKEENDI